jgi:hypothetical protein
MSKEKESRDPLTSLVQNETEGKDAKEVIDWFLSIDGVAHCMAHHFASMVFKDKENTESKEKDSLQVASELFSIFVNGHMDTNSERGKKQHDLLMEQFENIYPQTSSLKHTGMIILQMVFAISPPHLLMALTDWQNFLSEVEELAESLENKSPTYQA